MKISNWAKLDLLLLACRRQITPEGISVFDDDQWVQCSEKYIRRDVNFSGVWRVETLYKNTQYDGYYMLEGMGGPHTAWHEREDGKCYWHALCCYDSGYVQKIHGDENDA